jgi:hypothetical protein
MRRRGERTASHPADNGDVRAGGEATFRRHPVRVRGLLVRCGRRERTTTTTSDGPPNDDEKGGNVSKLWVHATVFFCN